MEFDKYLGKEVQLKVDFPQEYQETKKKRVFIYHGKLLENSKDNVEIDDAVFGSFVVPKSNILTIRELNTMDYIYLANKFDIWAFKLKARQKDEKMSRKLKELGEKFRKMMHDYDAKYDKKTKKK